MTPDPTANPKHPALDLPPAKPARDPFAQEMLTLLRVQRAARTLSPAARRYLVDRLTADLDRGLTPLGGGEAGHD